MACLALWGRKNKVSLYGFSTSLSQLYANDILCSSAATNYFLKMFHIREL